MVDDLPTGYYRDNFVYLADFVQSRYGDLLNDTERQFCEDFAALSMAEQRLYVRLVSRKGPYFRTDKLQYDEIEHIDRVIEQLVTRGFILRNHVTSTEFWLHLATRPEVLACFTIGSRASKKADLCTEIEQRYGRHEIQDRLPFELVEPAHGETLKVLKLLFFGNLYQDLTEFVLRDLGISPFEPYSLDVSDRYFDQRADLDGMLAAYELQDLAYATIEAADQNLRQFAEAHLIDIDVQDPQVQRRYSKILNRVARQLERESDEALALRLYRQSNLTPARERSARLLAGGGQAESALKTCEEIVSSPKTEAEYEFAVSFGNRMAKKHDLPTNFLPARPKDCFPVDQLELTQEKNLRVEATVARHLSENGSVALHVENALLPGLFGLFFWDIIFAPIRGAFFNPFHRGPVDLFTDQFLKGRRQLIEQRMSELVSDNPIAREEVEARILNTYQEKCGIVNHFVMWRALSPELISLSLCRIPREHLLLIFERLLRDLKANKSGFPDLVVFSQNTGYELVEVKGPGDTLQDNQKRWLRFFTANEIPARVVNVCWSR